MTDILYGIHPVLEAIAARKRLIRRIHVSTGRRSRRIEEIAVAAETRGIPVAEIGSDRLKGLAGTSRHQGVCAHATPFPYISFDQLLNDLSPDNPDPFWLVLDSVQDPHNLGALIRTALCTGIDAIVLPKDRSASATPAVSKASAGALEHCRLVRVTNLSRTLSAMQNHGVWMVRLDSRGAENLFRVDLTGPLALVVGGEEKGVRPLVKKHCDYLLAIPQVGPLGSLNASVAGAVAMYEAYRQRNRDPSP